MYSFLIGIVSIVLLKKIFVTCFLSTRMFWGKGKWPWVYRKPFLK